MAFKLIFYCCLFQLHVQRQHHGQQGRKAVRESQHVHLSSGTRELDHVRVQEGSTQGRFPALLQERIG